MFSAGTVAVNKSGTLNVTKASGAGVNVAGNLNIKTEYDASGTGAYGKTGLALGDNAITIATGGTVTLGGEGALTALGISGKKTVKAADISGTATNADVSGSFHPQAGLQR